MVKKRGRTRKAPIPSAGPTISLLEGAVERQERSKATRPTSGDCIEHAPKDTVNAHMNQHTGLGEDTNLTLILMQVYGNILCGRSPLCVALAVLIDCRTLCYHVREPSRFIPSIRGIATDGHFKYSRLTLGAGKGLL